MLCLGADHVIATEEEDIVARVKEDITGGKGAPVIFDPVAGPFLESWPRLLQTGGIVFE